MSKKQVKEATMRSDLVGIRPSVGRYKGTWRATGWRCTFCGWVSALFQNRCEDCGSPRA